MNTGRPHPGLLLTEEGTEDTPIDRLEITLAGQRMSIRQAAMRILRRPFLNFGQEYMLLSFVKMSAEKKLSVQDLNQAFDKWTTSRGADSMNYLQGIVRKIVDENERQRLMHRTPTPKALPEVILEKDEADRFLVYLKDRHHHGTIERRGETIIFQAEEIEYWYEKFRRDAIKETEERIQEEGK